MYLLDTNTVSYFMRGEGRVGQRILACRRNELAISSLSDYELWIGALKACWSVARIETMFTGLAHMSRIDFTSREAHAAARISAALSATGQTIGLMDSLIAGVALSYEAIFVTRNLREFRRVPGLNVEDWY